MSEPLLEPGALIAGRYRLERLLGEGGMAIVWEATHTGTHRAVALKFLRQALRDKENFRLRFQREASAASALRHPNVVGIMDVFGFEAGAPVIAMELLHGETLGQKLAREEKLGLEQTAALMVPLSSAVGTAHALGIVHRDLKPDNVFLSAGPSGTVVKVLDFGIAKLTTDIAPLALHTTAGSMLGTPYYMAPEQASSNGVVDHRADIWSLGVMLYECLAGTRPIEGGNLAQLMSRLENDAIMPLDRLAPELPHDVSSIVMRMLARNPLRRPAELGEVSHVLARYTRVVAPAFGPPATGRPWAATLPLPSPVVVVGPDTRARTRRSKAPLLGLAGALALVSALVVLSRSSASHEAAHPARALPLVKPSAGPAVTAAPSVVPLRPVNAEPAPSPSPAAPAAPKLPVQRIRPAATVPPAASSAPPVPEIAVAKPWEDESTILSDRK